MTNRIDTIGQNGNTALHYVWHDLDRIKVVPNITLCEQVLAWNCGWRDHWRRTRYNASTT